MTHIYDFGSSTETLLTTVDVRLGKPLTDKPIFQMGRNKPPAVECMECSKPASWMCFECIHENGDEGTLCEEHMKRHECDEFGGPVPLVNSPRIGVCAYSGPAEPPY